MHSILSGDVFLISCLILYFFSYNIGIGPVKHILLRWVWKCIFWQFVFELKQSFPCQKNNLCKVLDLIRHNKLRALCYSELFPPEDQKFVAGLCNTWYWVTTFACNKAFHYLVQIYGLANIFLSISVILTVNIIFTVFFIPETKISCNF